MLYPPRAVERAMQVKEVMLRAMNKEYSWLRAAEILGITPRGLRRLRQRLAEFGYEGLVDRRQGRPSHRLTPVAEMERILELYRERYAGFNGRAEFRDRSDKKRKLAGVAGVAARFVASAVNIG